MDTLYLVIPCYNEEEVLPETSKQLLAKMQSLMAAEKISEKSRIVFVNDGSKDRTWEIIQALHQENPIYQGVCLSRNRGHQNALLGGLMTVKNHCDITCCAQPCRCWRWALPRWCTTMPGSARRWTSASSIR